MAVSESNEDLRVRFYGLCYDLSRFVDQEQIEEEYKCPVYKGVLNNPKTVPCQYKHVICFYCILRCRANSVDGEDGQPSELDLLKCPLCRKEFHRSELSNVSLNFKNLLNKKKIKCSFEGCNKIVELGDLAVHEYRCKLNPEREATCEHCDKKLQHSLLKDHCCKEAVMSKLEKLEQLDRDMNRELDEQSEILNGLLK